MSLSKTLDPKLMYGVTQFPVNYSLVTNIKTLIMEHFWNCAGSHKQGSTMNVPHLLWEHVWFCFVFDLFLSHRLSMLT